MKVNNPLKEQSRKNIEELLLKHLQQNENMWDVIERHNQKFNDKLILGYDPKTLNLILI